MSKRLMGHSDSIGDLRLDVARGIYPNAHWVDKFGSNYEVDIADASRLDPLPIWEFGKELGNTSPGYTYLPYDGITDPINALSSSSEDDNNSILVEGLDFSGSFTRQIIQISGQNKVSLTTPLWRVFRMINLDLDLITGLGTSVEGVIYCYQGSSSITNGVPDDLTKVKAVINNGFNQTQMAIYTIPAGITGYLIQGEAGISKSSTDLSVDLCYRSRRFGGPMTIKKSFSATTHGSSNFVDERSIFDSIPPLTDIEVCVTRVSANDVGVWGAFDILLIDEDAEKGGYVSNIIESMR